MGTNATEEIVDTTAADDAAAAAALAAESPKPTDEVPAPTNAPDTYDLKVPEGSTVDPAIVERTAATARVLGLTNEAAQTLLNTEVERATEQADALSKAQETAQTALLDAWKPGGAEWTKQQETWTKAVKADPEIGGAQFAQSIEKGKQALAKYGTPELKTFLEQTGYGSHPDVVKFLTKIGKAMGEGAPPPAGSPASVGHKSIVNKFFGGSTPEPE